MHFGREMANHYFLYGSLIFLLKNKMFEEVALLYEFWAKINPTNFSSLVSATVSPQCC